ncbi:MAG TPA: hypothetical protein VHW00_06595 [Thermoanaerobaculia bacterium]|nr:hypothetical protein [Thermoanaerobaculia bacterium]
MPAAYEFQIRVKGSLADHWAERFDGATLRPAENGDTNLEGRAVDQPALFGLLRAIENFGLTVVSVLVNVEQQ